MSDRLESALAELAEAIRAELRAELRDVAGAPDRLLDVGAAAEALSIGRTALYSAISRGQIRSIVVGRRRLIPASAIAELARAGPEAE